MSSIEKKIGTGIIFQFFSFGIAGLVQILFIPFIINKLGKEQYGIYAIAYSLTLFNALLEIGIGSTITNYIKKYYDKGSEEFRNFFWSFFWFKLAISIIICIICLIIAFNTDYLYSKIPTESIPILQQSIIWFAFGAILFNLVSFFNNVQTGFIRYDLNSITNISSKLFFIIVFFLWFYNWNNLSIADYCFISFILVPLFRLGNQILLIFIQQREILTQPTGFKYNQISSKFHFLGGFSLITFIAQFYKHGIQFLLGLVAAPTIVGEYDIINQVLHLINGISDMLIRPIMPAAKDLLKKYKPENIVLSMTKLHSVVVLGLAMALIINSPALSKFFLNNKYPLFGIHLTIMTLPKLLPSVIVMLMLYYSEGKTKLSIYNQSLRVSIALLLGYIGFKLYNFNGLLVGLSFGAIIAAVINLQQFFSYYKEVQTPRFLNIYLQKWLAVILCIICQIFIQRWLGITLISVILWNILGATIFLFFSKKDIEQLLQRAKAKL